MIDPAVGVTEDDLVTLLHCREVETLVVAFGTGPTDPVAGDVSIGSLLPGEAGSGDLDGAYVQGSLRVIVSYGVAVDA